MVVYNFRTLKPVPSGPELLDIVLSRTQRKTATQVHKRFAISRIRTFYMMKIKFTQSTFSERIGQIVDEFPRLDSIHPFYADLINVLYDRDHYKLALGQLNTARSLIDNIAKDYVRLLKFGDSLYRCKHLKRAALGRMATVIKKLKASLGYLEQVRQHLARLPSIDPSTRTLMLTGYPNVGKSSFINKVTRADVDVQPYAFTTKSLFVGHMDYKYLRWQVIDTPGILDHPLEQRNTIEMQAVTALAHLNCAVLFLLDVSGHSEYSLQSQVSLFHNIRPLFANKPLLVVANKTDVRDLEALDDDDKASLKTITDLGVSILPMSNVAETGIIDVKTTACDLLLQHRVSHKLKTNKVEAVRHRIHVAMPVPRDQVKRPVHIPASVRAKQRGADGMIVDRKTMKMVEDENGGAGVFNFDMRSHWQLDHDEWKHDQIPEIFNGKNVADFFDADIEARLDALDQEEAHLVQVADQEQQDDVSDLDEDTLALYEEIEDKKKRIFLQAQRMHSNNSSVMPRPQRRPTRLQDFEKHLNELGLSSAAVRGRSRACKRPRSVARGDDDDDDDDAMQVDGEKTTRTAASRSKSRAPSVAAGRQTAFANDKQRSKAQKLAKKSQTMTNLMGRAGESDRHIRDKKPKHLFSGKRGIGKTDRR